MNEAKKIIREIKLLKILQNENIISIKDIFEHITSNNIVDIYIVTDLLGTDLHKVIYSSQVLTKEHIQYMMYQLVIGVYFMHSTNIIHRDLKPSNILLKRNCDLKICDFGMARELENNIVLTDYVITRWYRAPEVLLSLNNYGKPVDIWSIGCIFAELLARKPFIPGRNFLYQIKKIFEIIGTPSKEDIIEISGEIGYKFISSIPFVPQPNWNDMLQKANATEVDLLSKMLTFNPKKRITIDECVKHPYFEGLHEIQFVSQCLNKYDSNWETKIFTEEELQQMFNDLKLSFQY